jgi:sugar phosphate isomerase/epimerase
MHTRTGNFRIGFRFIGRAAWQQDLAGLGQWAKQTGFELIDLFQVTSADVRKVKETGVDVVSVDLLDWPALLSDDAGKRKETISKNIVRFKEMAALGVKVFFAVIIPENIEQEPRKNFDLAVESYGELARAAESLHTAIVLEGWPGRSPTYPNLCCNPEQFRAMFKAVPSRGLMINYDSSHLIRMGIDHIRFVDEFADRIGHVHGKDCEILSEGVYDLGYYQPSIFDKPHVFGDFAWRYTIPGHGITRWSYIFRVLQSTMFSGVVSVELEDENFNGTEEGEKAGLLASLNYLRNV